MNRIIHLVAVVLVGVQPGSIFGLPGKNRTHLPPFHDPYFLANRSGIVHLFEWKYSDIALECEQFLGPNGFGGVQVSPASENLVISGRPWYERYQPISYEILSRSGDSADFLDMTKRCNAVGVRIYVDVVINHMTANKPNSRGVGHAFADSDNFYYPQVPFSKEDFHSPCQINDFLGYYEARNCELVGLHDLDHSRLRVRWAVILFLDRLTALGAAGFRVDATKHMWPQDLQYIYAHVNDLSVDQGFKPHSRPFIYQEVGDNWKYNYTRTGAVTEFAHVIYMAQAMKRDIKLSTFSNYGPLSWNLLPTESAFVFVDNHDLQRQNPYSLNYKMPREFKMAYAFTLAYPFGIPRIMSSFNFTSDQEGPPADSNENIISPEFDDAGQCTNGWVCEHRWNAITNMVKFKNIVGDAPLKLWYDDGDAVAGFSRGNLGFIIINSGTYDFQDNVKTTLPEGTYCDIISGKLVDGACTGTSVIVDENGYAAVNLPQNAIDGVIAIHSESKLI